MEKCNKENCLTCELLVCVHDIADRKEYLARFDKLKEKEHHAKYYKEHREAILAKQRERDKDRVERTKRYYEKHKDEITAKHRANYRQNREERLRKQAEYYQKHKDEINARRREKRHGKSIYQGQGSKKE